MGRLSGFRYREITGKLRRFGFVFDRQAAGSHEIWYSEASNRYTTIPNHAGTCRKEHCDPSSGRLE
jgi:predicted RNA binding protein YcfA (HicA-like mRNA interferase family)